MSIHTDIGVLYKACGVLKDFMKPQYKGDFVKPLVISSGFAKSPHMEGLCRSPLQALFANPAPFMGWELSYKKNC